MEDDKSDCESYVDSEDNRKNFDHKEEDKGIVNSEIAVASPMNGNVSEDSESKEDARKNVSRSGSSSNSIQKLNDKHRPNRSFSRSPSKDHDESRKHKRSERRHSRSLSSKKDYDSSRNLIPPSKKYDDNRENPNPSKILGVFGLSSITRQEDLEDLFSAYGPLDKVQLIIDYQTKESRGFGFIYFRNLDDASKARKKCNGMSLDGRNIRIDYSVTKRAHDPTPGVYLGKRPRYYRQRFDDRDRDRYRDRDRDQYRGRDSRYYYPRKSRHSRYSRSRSRSGSFYRRRRSRSYSRGRRY